ncbi:hypothetical protein ACIBCO_36105 [Streptomyces violascens]|uniref:hypothetical protein n=1 Tax=Streptomyces violascens TaxID=67381 RepID=UPI0037AAE80E
MAAIPQDLLDRIRDLERRVHELTGRANIRPALNQITHGAVQIGEGGSLDVRSPGGAQVLGVGQFSTGRYGVSMEREDGTGIALEVGGNATNAAQMIRLYPRGGYPSTPIVMDDAHADGYLGRPWVPIPLAPSATVTAADWTTTHAGTVWTQHAMLVAYWSIYAPSGTTAEARLVVNRGGSLTQLGDTVTASGKEIFTAQRIAPRTHGLAHGDTGVLLIQARRTAGTGTAISWCQGMWGTHTANPAEAGA